MAYQFREGPLPVVTAAQSGEFSQKRTDEKLQLHFFAHGECQCTRASLQCLEKVIRRSPLTESELSLHLHIFQPYEEEGFRPMNYSKDLAWKVSAESHSSFFRDRNIVTSGHVRLFRGERTAFNGGVTLSRGNPDTNEYSATLLEALTNNKISPPTPVYGCAFFE